LREGAAAAKRAPRRQSGFRAPFTGASIQSRGKPLSLSPSLTQFGTISLLLRRCNEFRHVIATRRGGKKRVDGPAGRPLPSFTRRRRRRRSIVRARPGVLITRLCLSPSARRRHFLPLRNRGFQFPGHARRRAGGRGDFARTRATADGVREVIWLWSGKKDNLYVTREWRAD